MPASETITVPTQHHGISMPSSTSSKKLKNPWQSHVPFIPTKPRPAEREERLSRENTRSSAQTRGSKTTKKWWRVQLFRGMINDVRRRAPFYWSDWKDAWDYRVVPATVYMYFAKYVSLKCCYALTFIASRWTLYLKIGDWTMSMLPFAPASAPVVELAEN